MVDTHRNSKSVFDITGVYPTLVVHYVEVKRCAGIYTAAFRLKSRHLNRYTGIITYYWFMKLSY